jgi:hypothetical protein
VDDEDLAIASSTRGFIALRAGTPTVINPCSSTQDQDEKGSVHGQEKRLVWCGPWLEAECPDVLCGNGGDAHHLAGQEM